VRQNFEPIKYWHRLVTIKSRPPKNKENTVNSRIIFRSAALAAGCLLGTAAVWAQAAAAPAVAPAKVAIINFRAAIGATAEGKQASAELQSQFAPRSAEIDNLTKQINDLQQKLQAGQGKPAQWPHSLSPFPPMFLWLVRKGGEDIAAGFQKAAEIYQSRASYKIELLLYGALPVSVLFLGQMVLWQVVPLFHALATLMGFLGDMGG